MDTPIIFLYPPELENKTGKQRVDDATGDVVALLLDETGNDVTDLGVSYRNA